MVGSNQRSIVDISKNGINHELNTEILFTIKLYSYCRQLNLRQQRKDNMILHKMF